MNHSTSARCSCAGLQAATKERLCWSRGTRNNCHERSTDTVLFFSFSCHLFHPLAPVQSPAWARAFRCKPLQGGLSWCCGGWRRSCRAGHGATFAGRKDSRGAACRVDVFGGVNIDTRSSTYSAPRTGEADVPCDFTPLPPGFRSAWIDSYRRAKCDILQLTLVPVPLARPELAC